MSSVERGTRVVMVMDCCMLVVVSGGLVLAWLFCDWWCGVADEDRWRTI